MVNIIHKRNCVYQIAYHVVWCVKYRKEILLGNVEQQLKCLIEDICEQNNWPLITMEIQPDHIHLFLTVGPAVSVAVAVKILKGTTARKLFIQFPQLKQKLWGGHLWAPSYYVGTAGNVSAEVIQKYIERTEHVRGRR